MYENQDQLLSPKIINPQININKQKSNKINVINYQNLSVSLNRDKNLNSHKNSTKFYQKTKHKLNANGFGAYKQRIQTFFKPITFCEYEVGQFAIEPKSKIDIVIGKNIQKAQDKNKDIKYSGNYQLINPIQSKQKTLPKRLSVSTHLARQKSIQPTYSTVKKPSMLPIPNPIPLTQSQPSQSLYSRLVSQMNSYFTSLKQSYPTHNHSQLINKRGKSQTERRTFKSQFQKEIEKKENHRNRVYRKQNEEVQFNVVGEKTSKLDYRRIDRRQSANATNHSILADNASTAFTTMTMCTSQQLPASFSKNLAQKQLNPQLLKIQGLLKGQQQCCSLQNLKQSSHRIQSPFSPCSPFPPSTQILIKSPIKIRSTPISTLKRKSPLESLLKGYCFGEINLDKLSSQQVQRLVVLYYKDLLWKNMFNLGCRFFVGKGNNSKLIKTIMAKRYWWTIDNKQDNAQFMWTQLKIYSIYEKQQEHKPSIKSQIAEKNENLNNNKTQTKQIISKANWILNKNKRTSWNNYIKIRQNQQRELKATQQNLFPMRLKLLKPISTVLQNPKRLTNHLQLSRCIGNKKALYKVMCLYLTKILCLPLNEWYVPLTFHVTSGLQDQQYLKFLAQYYRLAKNQGKTCWILKPGELTNRGNGIIYCSDLMQIKPIIKAKTTHSNGTPKTFLIQQYIDKPLLYKGRKFDIRHYIMISTVNGKIRGYFYQQGYIRTTSYKYKLNDNSPAIHLTNDAVQKYCKDYGKYQKGNKLSYEQFDKYLESLSDTKQGRKNFYIDILPQIRRISTDIIHACSHFIDPKRRSSNFQIFGLDIMIDQQFKCYLIQVNTNPCLQLSSPVLQKVIPPMLDNAFSLTIDHFYPPPMGLTTYHKRIGYCQAVENRFQLVFDQQFDGKGIAQIYQRDGVVMGDEKDDEENYQSEDQEK